MQPYLIQGSESWKEARKMRVTATDSSCVLGINPYKSAYGLWRQKMDLDPPEEETERMRRGTMMEPYARDWFIKETGIHCEPAVLFKDFMMASLDGFSRDQKLVVEIKCGSKSFAQAEAGEISPMYICQMQHQMECANVNQSLFVAFNGEVGIIIPVDRDQEFINQMIEREREFYQCLLTFTPPTLTTKDYQMRSDPTWNNLAENYRKAYQDLKSAELLEESLRKELISLAGQQSTMGNGIKLSKVVKRGAINYSSIPQLIGLNLDEYRKEPSEYFRISVE